VWAVLVCLTARKALDLRAHDRRQKRGGGAAAGESVLDALFGTEDGGAGLGQVVGREPTPEFAAQAAETFRRLLAQLPTEELRAIALAKMEGFTNEEIAARRGCALATVERRLGLIRAVWQKELRAWLGWPGGFGQKAGTLARMRGQFWPKWPAAQALAGAALAPPGAATLARMRPG
jgi:hypothetical protein